MKFISVLVLLSLIAGLIAGALVRASGDPTLLNISSVIEPFGGLWLNTLRMTVVPLVVSLLITAIASVADTAKTGGLVARAILLFSVLLFFAATYSVLATNGCWKFGLWIALRLTRLSLASAIKPSPSANRRPSRHGSRVSRHTTQLKPPPRTACWRLSCSRSSSVSPPRH